LLGLNGISIEVRFTHTHTHKEEEEEEANHTKKIRNKSYDGEGEPTRQLFRVISLYRSPILYMLMRMLGFFFFFFFFVFFFVFLLQKKNKSNNAHNTNEKENVNENQKKENGKGEKKETCQVLVLKIPMHCDGYAGKIIRCICSHEGLSLTNLSIWPLRVVWGRGGDKARWGWSATPQMVVTTTQHTHTHTHTHI
jgi:cbb3-type cytochrome oxidase subunit 3